MPIMLVIVILSAVFIYLDARHNNIHKVNNDKSVINMSAVEWFWLTLLLWIITFPLYLINRKRLIAKCKGEILIKNGEEYRISQPDAIVQAGIKYARVEKKKKTGIIVLGVIIIAFLSLIVFNVRFVGQKDLITMSDYPILYNTAYGPVRTGITLGVLLQHTDVKVVRVGSFLYISLDKIHVICNLVKIVTEQGDAEVLVIDNYQFANIDMILAKIKQLNHLQQRALPDPQPVKEPICQIYSGYYYLVSADGAIISKKIVRDPGLVVISGLNVLSDMSIEGDSFNKLNAALLVIEDIKNTYNLSGNNKIVKIIISDIDNLVLILKNGTRIELGRHRFRDKSDTLKQIINKLKSKNVKAKIIDLRFIDVVIVPEEVSSSLPETEKKFIEEVSSDEIEKSIKAAVLHVQTVEDNKEYIRSVLSDFPGCVLKVESVGNLEIIDITEDYVTFKMIGRVTIGEKAYNDFLEKFIAGLDKVATNKKSSVISYSTEETLPMSLDKKPEYISMSRDELIKRSERLHTYKIRSTSQNIFSKRELGPSAKSFFVLSVPEKITSNRKKENRLFYLLDGNIYGELFVSRLSHNIGGRGKWVQIKLKFVDSQGLTLQESRVNTFGKRSSQWYYKEDKEFSPYVDSTTIPNTCTMMSGIDPVIIMSNFGMLYDGYFSHYSIDLMFEREIMVPNELAEKITAVEMEFI